MGKTVKHQQLILLDPPKAKLLEALPAEIRIPTREARATEALEGKESVSSPCNALPSSPVTVDVCLHTDFSRVANFGTPEELLQADVMSAFMWSRNLEIKASRSKKRRFDERGDRFNIDRRSGERVRCVRFVTDETRALALLGVAGHPLVTSPRAIAERPCHLRLAWSNPRLLR